MEDMDFGRCYAIEFDNGTVKIGKTTNIVDRIRNHKGNAARFNVGIVSMIFTDVIPFHGDMERKVLSDACSICDLTKSNEYFNGITIHDCMGFFHSYGVNYIRTSTIPKITESGHLLVTISSSPDAAIHAIPDREKIEVDSVKEFDDIVMNRIRDVFDRSKVPLSPSVIVQRCVLKKYNITEKNVKDCIKLMMDTGTIRESIVVHAKTHRESVRYTLA